jgi:hypothetical protein
MEMKRMTKPKENKISESKKKKDLPVPVYDGSSPHPLAQRELFCLYYESSGNGVQSALRAEYSEKGAHAQASRLLTDVKVKKRLTYLRKQRREILNIDSQIVLEGLRHVIDADIFDFFDIVADKVKETIVGIDKNGKKYTLCKEYTKRTMVLKPGMPIAKRRLIEQVKLSNNGMSISLEKKMPARQKLGEYLGLWKNDVTPDDARVLPKEKVMVKVRAMFAEFEGEVTTYGPDKKH